MAAPVGADGLTERVLGCIRDVPDYPKPGIVFKDINPLLADGRVFGAVVESLAERYAGRIDVVAGIEARGFVLGAPLAVRLGIGFVPVRKAGKLPGDLLQASYDLEYGSASIEVQHDGFAPGARAVVVDDVLATGGTAASTCELVERAGAVVVEVAVLMELGFLSGRGRLADRVVHSVVTV